MTREEVIRAFCTITGAAYCQIGDYNISCDCFCNENTHGYGYSNDGTILRFVMAAVREKLLHDGIGTEEYDKLTRDVLRKDDHPVIGE